MAAPSGRPGGGPWRPSIQFTSSPRAADANPPTPGIQASIVSDVTSRTTLVPPSWAKACAALLVLNGTAYNVGSDVQRLQQAKVFGSPETFIQPQGRPPTIINGSGYNVAADVLRAPQAKIFGPVEAFPQVRAGAPLLTNGTTYNLAADAQRARQAKIFGPVEVFPQPWVGHPLLTNGSAYALASDVRFGANAKAWSSPESFTLSLPFNQLVVNGSGYAVGTDVPRTRQAVAQIIPELFGQPQRSWIVVTITGYVPYNPATDVRFGANAKVWSTPEFFLQPRWFNGLIRDGSAPVIIIPTPPAKATNLLPGKPVNKGAPPTSDPPESQKGTKLRADPEPDLGKGLGPYKRAGQVFGDQDPVSPFLTSLEESRTLSQQLPLPLAPEPLEATSAPVADHTPEIVAILLLAEETGSIRGALARGRLTLAIVRREVAT